MTRNSRRRRKSSARESPLVPSALDLPSFLKARKAYWQAVAKEWGVPLQNAAAEVDGFLIAEKGPADRWAIFEDDTRTGYLYSFSADAGAIDDSVQVYVRTDHLDVAPRDVRLYWSNHGDKCAVAVWSHLRAIIDIEKGEAGGAALLDKSSPGINDEEWLRGFEYLYD